MQFEQTNSPTRSSCIEPWSRPSLSASVEAVIGKTWNFKQSKITGTIIYTTSTVAATFGGKTYEGTLRIEGDQICTKYPKIKKGAETCFGISKTAKGYKTRTAQRSGHKRGRATASPASARFGEPPSGAQRVLASACASACQTY
ncbi:hypothetical protein [Mesorhizobium sp.]|uniref:hypothetical protein n=1 Tax=Mesorhizobium sp. TaxID=1871066 RepID=UPI000FE45BF0|nr:hypothetical protein [Mesorhizobium sp.]RWO88951.1 MAG: hypothetical protein EOQ95_17405 [Mesorhizobium sp.]RWQ51737.1 MAG: hypothetical protein EOS84_19880 [Mesorhizobium sp.]TIM09063.1 MAG: hypothetical protein E5Y62_12895 [Mesorhizobium sp.]